MQGWPPGEAALYTPFLLDCYDTMGDFSGFVFQDKTIHYRVNDLLHRGAFSARIHLAVRL